MLVINRLFVEEVELVVRIRQARGGNLSGVDHFARASVGDRLW